VRVSESGSLTRSLKEGLEQSVATRTKVTYVQLGQIPRWMSRAMRTTAQDVKAVESSPSLSSPLASTGQGDGVLKGGFDCPSNIEFRHNRLALAQ